MLCYVRRSDSRTMRIGTLVLGFIRIIYIFKKFNQCSISEIYILSQFPSLPSAKCMYVMYQRMYVHMGWSANLTWQRNDMFIRVTRGGRVG